MNKEIINEAISCLNTDGYYKTSVYEVFSNQELDMFQENKKFFDEMLNSSQIKNQMQKIETNPSVRLSVTGGKPFEIVHNEYLKGPLTLNNSQFIKIYTSDFFDKISQEFLATEEPKIFNVLAWIHYWKESYGRLHSQNWHRDREDYKIMKAFIYYSDVSENDGPFEYVPKSFCGGDFYGLYSDRSGYWDYTPDKSQNTGLPKSQTEIQVCDSTFVSLTGKEGDIILANNTGFHRGGFVKNGIRMCSHALFLHPDAHMIKNENYFSNFNYAKETVNFIDFESEEFIKLDKKQKFFKSE